MNFSFQIKVSSEGFNIFKFVFSDNRNKKIRYQLKVAIKKRDKFELEYSINEFTKAKLSDDEMDLERAKRLLKQLSAKDGLFICFLYYSRIT